MAEGGEVVARKHTQFHLNYEDTVLPHNWNFIKCGNANYFIAYFGPLVAELLTIKSFPFSLLSAQTHNQQSRAEVWDSVFLIFYCHCGRTVNF